MTSGLAARGGALLTAAIVAEVIGTMSLRAAVDDAAWTPLVLVAYACAFVLLGLTMRAGVPIGVAYGMWAAGGVALTAMLGAVLFAELMGPISILGIGLIIIGVVLIETGSPAHRDTQSSP